MNSALDKVIEYIDYQQVELIAEAKQELSDLRTKVASLEARLAEALERNVNKWQPIETAPIKPVGDYFGLVDRVPIKMYYNYERDGWVDCCTQEFAEYPTHWMPLPEPLKNNDGDLIDEI